MPAPMATNADHRIEAGRSRRHADPFPLLRRTELRRFLTEGQIAELERVADERTPKPGVTLFRQDDPAQGLFLLIEGTVELRARPPGRRGYRTIELVRPVCTFGEESVVGFGRYFISARTLEQARVLSLSRATFDRLAESRPDVALGMLRCSGSGLIQTVRRSAILTQAPALVALRMLLEELVASARARNGQLVPIRITQAQLAGILHLSRETVSRLLGQLASQGRVELGRGVIRVRRI